MVNVVIIAHKFLTQPDDDLVSYLNSKKYENVLHIRHSFAHQNGRSSYYSWYKKGLLFDEKKTIDFKFLPEPLVYIKEIYYTYKWLYLSKLNWDYSISMDGFLAFFTGIFKKFLRLKKTIFWVIDIVPKNRFESKIKNMIYFLINKNSYRFSNEVWDLSPRMNTIRKQVYGFKANKYSKHKLVPYGVWINRIKKYSYARCDKNTLVYMGILLEKQGVQLVIKAMPYIIKKIPNFKFKIIGDGRYKNNLIELAKELNVIKNCIFLGKIENHIQLEKEIAKSALAIAPYIKKLDTWTYYADPGKVKVYLGCGVPVLLTDVPWNAKDIERKGCGKIIKSNELDIAKNICSFMKSSQNDVYRKNARDYAEEFSYDNIFYDKKLFEK